MVPAAKQGVMESLAKAGVRIMKPDEDTTAPLVMIFGDEETPAFRDAIARMALAGRFKGKAVAWMVPCRESSALFSRFLLVRGEAAAVLGVYRGFIPAVTEHYLTALVSAVPDIRPSGESIQEIVARAARIGRADAGKTRLGMFMQLIEASQVRF